jgi:hypothetical protein
MMGTAVFYEQVEPGTDLEQVALGCYQHFVGANQERDFIDSHWMRAWELIYQRPAELQPDFFRDLTRVASDLDYADRLAGDLDIYLYPEEMMDDADVQYNDAKRGILAAAFDAPEVNDFRVYTIGDSGVLEGLLILAGRSNGEVIILTVISD